MSLRRWARVVTLKDDPAVIAEYERLHGEPWPEIAQGMRASGVQRCYIFRRGNLLFFFGETDDAAPKIELPAEVQQRLAEWGVIMTAWQAPIPGYTPDNPDDKWAPMDEIYTFESDA
jgi:L-rhamnose mutarotase